MENDDDEETALSLSDRTRRHFNNFRSTSQHSTFEMERRHSENHRGVSKENHMIDFVLAYELNDGKIEKRERFERSLEEVGLLLEREEFQCVNFLKIQVPQDVLFRYAEILKLRMPLKSLNLNVHESHHTNRISKFIAKILDLLKVRQDPLVFPLREYKLTAEFSRDKLYLFDVNSEDYFNKSTRISVVSYILERELYSDREQDKGIKKLLAEGVYNAAYPLHDGTLHDSNSLRKKLFDNWASVTKWIKYQPIDDVKDYFGVKIALYFTWLGFYTHMLIPASLFGIFCLVYAMIALPSDKICQDICHSNITMCPMCDKYCPYWELKDTCTHSKISYLIDNPSTIVFAVFMSVWSALYLELWKRYSADVAHRWGLSGFDLQAEPPRPEYLAKLTDSNLKKLNVVTMILEPAVPFWKVKLPSIILSFGIVFLCMFLTIVVVFSIIVVRMSLLSSDSLYAENLSYRVYAVPLTAGLVNLVCIVTLNFLYNKLAIWLTEIEMHRTQTEYEDSLTLKIYMFQFVNYYTSIFYIALLKGKFLGYPGKYNRVLGYRQEECQPGGCLIELTMQLAVVMVGNQVLNSILGILRPILNKWYNKIKMKWEIRKKNCVEPSNYTQWTHDYNLLDFESQGLFIEYLKMVLQFGFVTIFVTAFPLAPLFALINNVIVMRLDAKKLLKFFRRPVPKRVKDIGVWLHIMSFICRISVVTNGFIIAFSSEFIPKLVYILQVSKDSTQEGFLEYTLAIFNTSDFMNGTAPIKNPMNVTMCRYTEFRNPPDHSLKYLRPLDYWHILAARLAFIVVYQNLVGFIITCIQWAIPDIPSKLSDTIKREAYEIHERIIAEEKEGKGNKKCLFQNGDENDERNDGTHQRLNKRTNEDLNSDKV